MVKRGISLIFLLIFLSTFLYGQEIVSADRFMEMVSNHYSGIRDFEANIAIRSGNTDMAGRISYLIPSFLRIDFTRPAEQLIVFNGEALNIYDPSMRATLNQSFGPGRRSGGTSAGLSLLRRNYVASFVTSPYPEQLDGSGERVIRLRLTRRSASEGFREIILSVNPDTRLIRRMEGITIGDTTVRFDFTNIRINQGIPEQRFVFDPPPGVSMYPNFLFRID
jgi:outer membrane lipoprotein-sorting protein